MGLAFLITSDNLQLLSERKVLKEREYAALLDASAVIATAREEAERIVAAAQREFDARQAAGYEEGLRRAQQEYAARTYSQALSSAKTMESMKDAMAEIVVKAVRTIVGEMGTQRLYEAALARIMPLVRDEPFLIVHVAPGHREEMDDALAGAFAGQVRSQKIRVVEDAQLAARACMVETPSGRIDASLDLQIDALRQAIRREPFTGAGGPAR
ncbi:type III secretion system stator protein SctL [Paraburkholderia flava]|uniref:type III secretion system stator protein SctL n=1 Tax=Paraburkholderia flava TaxID=2547393 RepID=UPI00105D99AF|nr:type III secretion system stator protein SctL [Paraburkholderia flava]